MTEATKQGKFEHWCLVELMGHQRVAGLVTEENLFGAALMRVDIPATANGRPGYTKYYGASAIYAVTPVEEAVARALANAYDVRPVDEWRLRSLLPEPEANNDLHATEMDQVGEFVHPDNVGFEDDDEFQNDEAASYARDHDDF